LPTWSIQQLKAGPVSLGNILDDGKPQTTPGTSAARQTGKALQNLVAHLDRNARAIIFHAKEAGISLPAGMQSDSPARRDVFERVVQQIHHHLAQQQRLARYWGMVQIKSKIDLACNRTRHPLIDQLGCQFGQINANRRIDHADARLNPRQ